MKELTFGKKNAAKTQLRDLKKDQADKNQKPEAVDKM